MLGVASRHGDLGASRPLTLAHELGHVLGQRLGAERALPEHDFADRLVDDLLEARHVSALLARAEVDEALHSRREQLLLGAVTDTEDLLHTRDAHAREADVQARSARLHIGCGDGGRPAAFVQRN